MGDQFKCAIYKHGSPRACCVTVVCITRVNRIIITVADNPMNRTRPGIVYFRTSVERVGFYTDVVRKIHLKIGKRRPDFRGKPSSITSTAVGRR